MTQLKKQAKKCPTCGKIVPPEAQVPPFCSKRCKLIDLGEWANEKYRVAGDSSEDLTIETEPSTETVGRNWEKID